MISKSKLLLTLLSVSVLCGASPAALAEEALAKPQLYDHNGTPVDPLCFLSNIGTEEEPIYPTTLCQWEEFVNLDEAPLDPERFVSVAYEESYQDPETDEVFKSNGFIGYRAIGHVGQVDGGHEAVLTVENGGGSGTFTTLMLLEMDKNEDNDTIFHESEVIAAGDRCMGGIDDAYTEDSQLHYTQHTTMADMLLLSGDPEREILKSDLYQSLPYCAACCYGLAHYDENGFTGISFTEKRHKPDADNETATCVENLVNLNVTNGITKFSKEDFDTFVREIEHTCLGRVEGE